MDQPVRPARPLDRGLRPRLRLTALALAAVLAAAPALADRHTAPDLSAVGPEAQTLVVDLTGLRLPEGVKITHAIPGGFQDPFIQFRAEAPPEALPALLRGLGVNPATLELGDFPARGDADPPWWDIGTPGTVSGGAGVQVYPYGTVYLSPGTAGLTVVQVFLFQT